MVFKDRIFVYVSLFTIIFLQVKVTGKASNVIDEGRKLSSGRSETSSDVLFGAYIFRIEIFNEPKSLIYMALN